MSAALNLRNGKTAPMGNRYPARPQLRVVDVPVLGGRFAVNPGLRVIGTFLIGALVIALLSLGINLATSTGVYQLLHLQNEQKKLQLQSQILSQQVNSLSSNQNLASAAQALGMVSNSAPVFLDVTNSKVYGSTSANSFSAGSISGSLIPNSQWTTKTSTSAIRKALAVEQAKANAKVVASVSPATAAKTGNQAAGKSSKTNASGYVDGATGKAASVGLAGGSIPVAPTH
jgi:hypothetical protein